LPKYEAFDRAVYATNRTIEFCQFEPIGTCSATAQHQVWWRPEFDYFFAPSSKDEFRERLVNGFGGSWLETAFGVLK